MKTDAAIRPINVLVGSETQFCVKKPPAPPIKVIDAAVMRLISKVDEFGEIFRVIISRAVINETAATAYNE